MQQVIPKISRMTMVLAACVSLAVLGACSPKEQAKTAQADQPETTLASIQKKGEITMGVMADTPPYGFVPQGQSQPIGFDSDIAHQIASRMKVKLNMVIVTSANRIANLMTKKDDIMVSSQVPTTQRDKDRTTR